MLELDGHAKTLSERPLRTRLPRISIEPGTHTLGPKNGTLSVRTRRAGAVAKAGHNLLIHVIGWNATLEIGDESSLVLEVDSTSLRVREGTGGMQALTSDDKANIEQTINDEVLLRTDIAFRSTSVRVDDRRLGVEGDLTLNGQTHPIAFELAVDAGTRLRGAAVVKQSEWGMTPYTALFGALTVTDDVEVAIDVTLAAAEEYELMRPQELKPALLVLDGISRLSVLGHHTLYEGYVEKRNDILERLATADRASANQISSEVRALKIELSFAIGAIRNHELYFEHLGGEGRNPAGAVGRLIKRDFGSADAWRADLKATAMGSRGWAWTAYDWDEGRLFNYLGDAQNAFPIWNATPVVALDVEEHAYVLDFGTDREAYIDAFFANLDWSAVNDRVWTHRIPLLP
jgi:superoxide dismutase, Fe-Mn family